MTDPAVRKSVTVRVPVRKAFEVFTDGIDSWWFRGRGPRRRRVEEGRAGRS